MMKKLLLLIGLVVFLTPMVVSAEEITLSCQSEDYVQFYIFEEGKEYGKVKNPWGDERYFVDLNEDEVIFYIPPKIKKFNPVYKKWTIDRKTGIRTYCYWDEGIMNDEIICPEGQDWGCKVVNNPTFECFTKPIPCTRATSLF